MASYTELASVLVEFLTSFFLKKVVSILVLEYAVLDEILISFILLPEFKTTKLLPPLHI